jgi:hypothetical protein
MKMTISPRKKNQMLNAFDAFSLRIFERYQEARKALEEDRYVDAQDILARLGRSHATTSLSLRNVLIQDGLLTPEDDK